MKRANIFPLSVIFTNLIHISQGDFSDAKQSASKAKAGGHVSRMTKDESKAENLYLKGPPIIERQKENKIPTYDNLRLCPFYRRLALK